MSDPCNLSDAKLSNERIENILRGYGNAQDDFSNALRELKVLREQCEWRPIETAPLDRPIMVTDGKIYGVAARHSWVEQDTIGFNNKTRYGFGEDTERPNPLAGQVHHYWSAEAGWCNWDDAEWEDGEYEQRGPRSIEPTHWREQLDKPMLTV